MWIPSGVSHSGLSHQKLPFNTSTYLDKKIETKYNDVIDQLAKEKQELLQIIDKINLELKAQKEELKKQSDEINNLKEELIQEKKEKTKLKEEFEKYEKITNTQYHKLDQQSNKTPHRSQ